MTTASGFRACLGDPARPGLVVAVSGRWQGPLSAVTSLDLAVDVTARALDSRGVDPVLAGAARARAADGAQPGSSYGCADRCGPPRCARPDRPDDLTGLCDLGSLLLSAAAAAVDAGVEGPVLVVTADRTSNGPHLVYPQPDAPGAAPLAEDWVLDNFRRDPGLGESWSPPPRRSQPKPAWTRV